MYARERIIDLEVSMTDNTLQIKRKELGMSQSQLAEASGVNFRTLQDYEQGRKQLLSARVDVAYRLSDALGCDIEDIIVEKSDEGLAQSRMSKYYMALHRMMDKGDGPSVHTPFDDVFKTITVKCRELIIPLINEAFSEHYKMSDLVQNKQNEHQVNTFSGETKKRLTDSNFVIVSNNGVQIKYQVECQSKPDNTMMVRLFEYSSAIAQEDASVNENELRISYPRSAIVYLRHNSLTPDNYRIVLDTPGGEISWNVPVIKSQLYSIDEIFEKKLYMLIPYYLLVYEKDLADINKDKERLEQLKNEYISIINKLEREIDKGNISGYLFENIKDLSQDIIDYCSAKYVNIKREVTGIMGGKVLDLPSFRAHDQGVEEGMVKGRIEGRREQTILTFKNCIERGMSREDAIAISGIEEKDIPK